MIRLPPGLTPLIVLAFILSIASPNAAIALVCLAALFVGAALLWRPGESPILFFTFGFLWIQAAIWVFHANVLGIPVEEYSLVGGKTGEAVVLTAIGIVFLAIGMRLGAGPPRPDVVALSVDKARGIPVRRWFVWYVYAALAASTVVLIGAVAPGLSQPLMAVAALKWAFFYMLAYASFTTAASLSLFMLAFGAELAQGVGGFFSDFRTVIFVSLLALVAAGRRPSLRISFGLASLAALGLALAIVWSAVKMDYRAIVSGGTDQQVVLLDYSSRIGVLYGLVSELGPKELEDGVKKFIARISYIDFFGAALDRVPESVPHSNGEIWLDAISRPFMPRILFPDKTAISDTDRTNFYTGQKAGEYEGTSISIGFVGESYIDFGQFGMMAALLLYGWLLGRLYRWFACRSAARGLFGMAIASAILLGQADLANSITKAFGGLVVQILVCWLFVSQLMPKYLPWLRPATR